MKRQFEELFKRCGANKEITESTWKFIVTHYTMPNRHYHNLLHIAKCLDAFDEYLINTASAFGKTPSVTEIDIIRLLMVFSQRLMQY